MGIFNFLSLEIRRIEEEFRSGTAESLKNLRARASGSLALNSSRRMSLLLKQ
jgi:hypothetical protein